MANENIIINNHTNIITFVIIYHNNVKHQNIINNIILYSEQSDSVLLKGEKLKM